MKTLATFSIFILLMAAFVCIDFAVTKIEDLHKRMLMVETKQNQISIMVSETYPKDFIPGEVHRHIERKPIRQK